MYACHERSESKIKTKAKPICNTEYHEILEQISHSKVQKMFLRGCLDLVSDELANIVV